VDQCLLDIHRTPPGEATRQFPRRKETNRNDIFPRQHYLRPHSFSRAVPSETLYTSSATWDNIAFDDVDPHRRVAHRVQFISVCDIWNYIARTAAQSRMDNAVAFHARAIGGVVSRPDYETVRERSHGGNV